MGNKNMKLWIIIALASLAVVGGSLWMFTSKSINQLRGSAGDAGVVNVRLSATNPQIAAAEINPGEFVPVASIDVAPEQSITYKSFTIKMQPGIANEISPGDLEVMVYRRTEAFNTDDAMTTSPQYFNAATKTATFTEDPAANLNELTGVNFFNVPAGAQNRISKIIIKVRARNSAATRGKHFSIGLQGVTYTQANRQNAGTALPIYGNEFSISQANVSNAIALSRSTPGDLLNPPTLLPGSPLTPIAIYDLTANGEFRPSHMKVSLRDDIRAVGGANVGQIMNPLIRPEDIEVQLFKKKDNIEVAITQLKSMTGNGASFEQAEFISAADANRFQRGAYELIIKARVKADAVGDRYFAVGFQSPADFLLDPPAQVISGNFARAGVFSTQRMMGADFKIGNAAAAAQTQIQVSPNTPPAAPFPWGRNGGQMAPVTALLVSATKDITVDTMFLSLKPSGARKGDLEGTKLTVQIFKKNAAGVEAAMSAPTVMEARGKTRIPLIRGGRLPLAEGPHQIIVKANTVEENSLLGRKFTLGVLNAEDIVLHGEPTPTGTFALWGNEQTIDSQARRAEVEAVQAAAREQAARDAAEDQAAADALQADPNNSTCPAHSHDGYPQLSKGMNNEKVSHLKKELNVLMHTNLVINTNFDQATADQVIAYKRSKGLPGTATVDAETWASIQSFINPACGVASTLSLVLDAKSPSQNSFNYDSQSFEVARFTFTPNVNATITNVTLKMKPGLDNPLPFANIVPELMVDLHEGHLPLGEGVAASGGASTPLNASGEKAIQASQFIYTPGRQYDLILRAKLLNTTLDAVRGKKIALGISRITFADLSQHVQEVLPIYGNTIELPQLEILQPTTVESTALPNNPLNGEFFELGKIMMSATDNLTIRTTKLHFNAVANSLDKNDIEVKLTRKQLNTPLADLSTAIQFNANNIAEFRSGNGGELTGDRGYDSTQTEYIGISVRVRNPDSVRGKMLSIGLTEKEDMFLYPAGAEISGNFPLFTSPVAIQERQRSAHGIAAAADMPAGQNMNPGGSFVTVGSFTLTPRRVVRANGITVSIQPTAAFTTSDVEAQLFVINENGAETAFTEIRAFDAASNNIVFGEQNGMSQSVLFDPPEVAHKIIIKVRVKDGSSADAASFRVGITGAHDMSFTTLEETEAGLTGTPVLSNAVTITVPHPAAEDPVDDVVLNEDPVPAETCESHGQFTYDGPERPGVRIVGMCIPCPTETYIAFGGACEAPQAEVIDDVAPAADDSGNGDLREAAPDLGQTQRIVRAPERGRTGPGLIPYIVTVGAANLAFFLNKGRRKKKHK
ncbi:peptidoglycan-binding protein [Candidatus Gracilibacteria bacterium]|nr:peptidoglycan-binding protein [Candidatus Gracilibacteria bacterium]